MPKLKPGTIWPSAEEQALIQAGIDADADNPEWTQAHFARARPAREVLPPAVYTALTDKTRPPSIALVTDEKDRLRQKKRGRPLLENPKVPIHIRISPHVLAAFRATGRGWQTRINAVLCDAVEQGRV